MSKENNMSPEHGRSPLKAGGAGELIYNVTMKVEPSIAKQWLLWLLDVHIPEVMATNCFLDYRVVKIIELDESEGPTYAIQYRAANQDAYKRYLDHFANALRDQSFAKWGDRFIAFRTLMEVIK